ncbi:EamA family transporter [Haladaptatus sp. DJG-WS-42]|uniref:EamA family transporter n=1 Tax=Haladaptatus sp. DJG-WS-42 TaxID=3120516 RepID=UPI0030CC6759
MALGGLGIYATSFLAGERASDIVWTQSAIVSLLYLGTAVSVGGYVLYFELIRRIGSNRTTLLAYLDPVIAGVAGFLLLGEGLELHTVAGFVVCLGFTIIEHRAIRKWISSR